MKRELDWLQFEIPKMKQCNEVQEGDQPISSPVSWFAIVVHSIGSSFFLSEKCRVFDVFLLFFVQLCL